MSPYCAIGQVEKSVSLLIHALQVTHHMKHDFLKSETFCHFSSPAELSDELTFLMISRIYCGRKKIDFTSQDPWMLF